MWLWLKKPEFQHGTLVLWKHGPKPAVCPSDRLILSHTHVALRVFGVRNCSLVATDHSNVLAPWVVSAISKAPLKELVPRWSNA